MSWPEAPIVQRYVLRLFVAGSTTRSQRAIASVHRLCEQQLAGRVDLEVVDVYTNPEATRDLQIVATPTLVRISPAPVRRLIGDLSDPAKMLAGLFIVPVVGASSEAPA